MFVEKSGSRINLKVLTIQPQMWVSFQPELSAFFTVPTESTGNITELGAVIPSLLSPSRPLPANMTPTCRLTSPVHFRV